VPAEVGLALEEKHFWRRVSDVEEPGERAPCFEGVVEGDCYGEAGGAEADADEVVDVGTGGGRRGEGNGRVDCVWTHGGVVLGKDGVIALTWKIATVLSSSGGTLALVSNMVMIQKKEHYFFLFLFARSMRGDGSTRAHNNTSWVIRA